MSNKGIPIESTGWLMVEGLVCPECGIAPTKEFKVRIAPDEFIQARHEKCGSEFSIIHLEDGQLWIENFSVLAGE